MTRKARLILFQQDPRSSLGNKSLRIISYEVDIIRCDELNTAENKERTLIKNTVNKWLPRCRVTGVLAREIITSCTTYLREDRKGQKIKKFKRRRLNRKKPPKKPWAMALKILRTIAVKITINFVISNLI